MRNVRLGLVLALLVVPRVGVADEPQTPPTVEQAVEAVLAALADGDSLALAALARADLPQQWVVADELIGRGQREAALALAKAAPRPATARLPAYVEAQGSPDEASSARRKRYAALEGFLRQRAFARAAALAPPATESLVDVIAVRSAHGAGIALRQMGRRREAVEAFARAAAGAAQLGWWRRAVSLYGFASNEAYELGRPEIALRMLAGRLAAAEQLEHRPIMRAVLHNMGTVHLNLSRYEEALDCYRRSLALSRADDDRPLIAQTLHDIGVVQEHRDRHDEAAVALRAAADLFEALGDRAALVRALANLTRALDRSGDSPGAREVLGRARAAAGEDPASLALVLSEEASLLADTPRDEEALRAAGRAIAIFRELGDQGGAMLAEATRASIFKRHGRYEEAVTAYRAALAVARTHGTPATLADLLVRLAGVHVARSLFADAEAGATEALRIASKLGRVSTTGRARIILGQAATRRGAFAEARRHLTRARADLLGAGKMVEAAAAMHALAMLDLDAGAPAAALAAAGQALDLSTRAADVRGTINALALLGSIHATLGNFEKATASTKRALAMETSQGNPRRTAYHYLNLASMRGMMDDHDEALRMLQEARALFEKLGMAAEAATTRGNIGVALHGLGRSEEAEVEQRAALALLDGAEAPLRLARVLQNLGGTLTSLGRHGDAREALTRAAALLVDGVGPGIRARALGGLAQLHRLAGEGQQAVDLARQAVACALSIPRGLADEESARAQDRLAYLQEIGALAAGDAGRVEDLAWFLEVGRARALAQALHADTALRSVLVPAPLQREEGAARDALVRATTELRAAHRTRRLEAVRAARTRLEAAQRRMEDVVARIQRSAHAGTDLAYPEPAALADVQRRLAPSDVLVLYALTKEGAFALAIAREGTRSVGLGPSAAIEAAVDTLHADALDEDPATAVTRLRGLLVEPLGIAPAKRRILVSPAGRLAYLPFRLLCPERELVHVASATVYGILQDARHTGGEGVLALADPTYDSGPSAAVTTRGGWPARLAPLKATRAEAEAVGTVTLLGAEATEPGLRKALAGHPRWRAVHLACHGMVDPDRPLFSALAITPSEGYDGFLTCHEIFRMPVLADLVVLSACDTGKGRIYRSEGIVGLTRAFMQAGAPRVLCSLWKVDDEATQALMLKFYELWNPKEGKGLGAAAALKQAQAFVRGHDKWKHPYYWAAWVLWGLP